MHVQRNSESLFSNHCCSGKEISISYCERVSVASVIHHAKRMRRIICALSGATLFFYAISKNGMIIGKKVTEHKIMCFDILYNFCL